MDPLSRTARVIAIIQLTAHITKLIRSYYKGTRHACKEISELIDELNSFGIVLEQQQKISSKNSSPLPMLQKMVEAGGPLATCCHEKLLFQKKFSSDQSKVRRALKWPFEKEVFRIAERLFKAHGNGWMKPIKRELEEVLKQMIGKAGSVYLVFDALDECEEMDSLLEGLGDLRSWNQTIYASLLQVGQIQILKILSVPL
ncbi:MAG: hypothetical protein Q9164_006760 [Protoblastenia rupestris]